MFVITDVVITDVAKPSLPVFEFNSSLFHWKRLKCNIPHFGYQYSFFNVLCWNKYKKTLIWFFFEDSIRFRKKFSRMYPSVIWCCCYTYFQNHSWEEIAAQRVNSEWRREWDEIKIKRNHVRSSDVFKSGLNLSQLEQVLT